MRIAEQLATVPATATAPDPTTASTSASALGAQLLDF